MKEAQPREIQNYVTGDGRCPFSEWRDSLRDVKAKAIGLTQNVHIWWFVGAIPPWLPLPIVSLRKS